MFPATLDTLQRIAKLVLLAVGMAFAVIHLTAQVGFADNGVGLIGEEPVIAPTSTATAERAVVVQYLDQLMSADQEHVALVERAALGHAAIEALIDKSEAIRARLDGFETKINRATEKIKEHRAKLKSQHNHLSMEARTHKRCEQHHEAEQAKYPQASAAHEEHARIARRCRREAELVSQMVAQLEVEAERSDPFAKQKASLAAAREALDMRMVDLDYASRSWSIQIVTSEVRALLKSGRESLNRDVSDFTVDIGSLGDQIDAEMARLQIDMTDAKLNP